MKLIFFLAFIEIQPVFFTIIYTKNNINIV